ncbi:MAG TPA: PKD domain-containing protein, partial [Burkholderiaceae bacterium]
VQGRVAYANVTDAMVPAALGDTVLGVVGLQTVHLARVHAKRADATHVAASSTQAVTAVSIPSFPVIYGASDLPSATSATIGIITSGSLTQTIKDLKSFATSAGYPSPPVTTTVVGSASSGTSGIDEWNMDSQAALAAAGGSIKSLVLYNVGSLSDSDLTQGYNRAVTDNTARAINVSLGACETDEVSIEPTQDQIFETALTQGQMFSVSSGDSGAFECGTAAGKAQSYPAVSPYVMAVGGTTLSTSNGAWAGETAWSCTDASNCQQSGSGGAGGGPSLTEKAPSWQVASGVLGTSTMRGVPDIAYDASPSSGALVLVDGSPVQIGGTSLAAPLWAGFWARIQSMDGNSLPFPAQTLYQGGASHPEWFHDITSGNQGYAATTGWDYASGWGSIQVDHFATAFCECTPSQLTPDFSFTMNGLTASFVNSSTDIGSTINSYRWNFGDGTSDTVANPTHTYPAFATYTATLTVTDTMGNTQSKTEGVPVVQPPPVQPILANGGFESGSTGWTATSGVICASTACAGESAHGGAGFAWLDGYGSAHTDTLAQTVKLPSGYKNARMTFFLHVDTAEATTSTQYDKLAVSVTSGSTSTTIGTYSNLNAAPGYAPRTLDLTPWLGKTVTIRFSGTEDSSRQTSFVLDDIAITLQ